MVQGLFDSAKGRMVGAARSGADKVQGVGLAWRPSALSPVAPDAGVVPWTGSDNDQALVKLLAADPLGSRPDLFPGLAIDPDAIVLGALALAGTIERLSRPDEGDRADRMLRVIDAHLDALRSALELDDIGPWQLLAGLTVEWTTAQKTTLLIELVALDPFAPNELAWPEAHRDSGLVAIAELIGLTVGDVEHVLDTFVDAARAHRSVSLMRVGLYTVAGAAAIGGAGLLAAPVIGGALGAATGLGGAAATSHGLALIGAMAGTHSVAAGTVALTQAAAAAGAVGAGVSSALYQLGAAQTQRDLIKLQVAAKVVLVDLQRNDAAAHQLASGLRDSLDDLEARLEHELLVNDPDSDRITDLQRSALAIEDASRWVEGHCTDDDGSIVVSVAALRQEIGEFESALDAQAALEALDDDARAKVASEVDVRFQIDASLDRYDVLAGIAAGLVAALVDAFAVATPKTSPITTMLRELAMQPDNALSRFAKVPFDQSMGEGFTPNNHRALTPGHDPVIGLAWGTIDILRSTMTRTHADGSISIEDRLARGQIDNVAQALIVEVAHLISDVVTPAGLPLPGWAALTIDERTAAAAVKAYTDGYDTWHLPAMATAPAAATATVHAYVALRSHGDPEFAAKVVQSGSTRIAAVELIAHGVATAADVAQLCATGGNPLVVNYAQWITLARRVAAEVNQRGDGVTDRLVGDLDANRLTIRSLWGRLAPRQSSKEPDDDMPDNDLAGNDVAGNDVAGNDVV